MIIHISKIKLSILVLAILAATIIVSRRSFSEETKDFSNLTFTANTTQWLVFDHKSGMLYVYSQTDGRIRNIWYLESPGKHFKRQAATVSY